MQLGEALRVFRRKTYLHGDNWKALLLVRTSEQVVPWMHEANKLMAHGSMKYRMNFAERRLITEYGSDILFRTVDNEIKGFKFTQIMVGGDLERVVLGYYRPFLRSKEVPDKQLEAALVTM